MQRKKPKAKVPASPPATVDREAVTRLAYELYVRRGGEHGHELEDWLMAEKILIEQQKRPAPHRRASDSSRRLEDKFQH
jgi:hypothetical protein